MLGLDLKVHATDAPPFSAVGGRWLMRATLPVNTFPETSGGDTTGIGDFNVFAAYFFDTESLVRSDALTIAVNAEAAGDVVASYTGT